MITKSEHKILRQAAAIIKREFLESAPHLGQTDLHVLQIIGFGSFRCYTARGRTGINPNSKEEMQIPSKLTVKFKASKAWLKTMNGTKRNSKSQN